MLAELDNDFGSYSKFQIFKSMYLKTTQNELLQCILDVYHEEIRKEIENYLCVAVIADETTDVASLVNFS